MAGRQRLAEAFGQRFLPVMVPPWNHISERTVAGAAGPGLHRALDLSRPRRRRAGAGPGPGQRPLRSDQAGKPGARFAGTGKALADLVGHLEARRTGAADPAEPTGLVTHHLALDEPAWEFVAVLLRRTAAHPAAAWQSARDAFRP